MEYEMPNFSTTGGIEEIAKEGASQVPQLMPGILVLVYLVILAGGYFIQDRTKGAGNFLMWASISGLITTTGAFMLFLYDELVNIATVGICVAITVISAFAFLITQRD